MAVSSSTTGELALDILRKSSSVETSGDGDPLDNKTSADAIGASIVEKAIELTEISAGTEEKMSRSSLRKRIPPRANSSDADENPEKHLKRLQKRRMSTLDVLYQMQTSQLEETERESCCEGGILHPHSSLRSKWDFLVTILLAYNAWTIPYRACFSVLSSTGEFIFWFDRFVDLVFVVDVVLNFQTGFIRKNDGLVETNPQLVRIHYLKTWFLPDLISSVPYELIFLFSFGDDATRAAETPQLLRTTKLAKISRYIRIAKIFKMIRLLRMLHISKRFEKAIILQHNYIQIIKFM